MWSASEMWKYDCAKVSSELDEPGHNTFTFPTNSRSFSSTDSSCAGTNAGAVYPDLRRWLWVRHSAAASWSSSQSPANGFTNPRKLTEGSQEATRIDFDESWSAR